jgi:hypothetical protein
MNLTPQVLYVLLLIAVAAIAAGLATWVNTRVLMRRVDDLEHRMRRAFPTSAERTAAERHRGLAKTVGIPPETADAMFWANPERYLDLLGENDS